MHEGYRFLFFIVEWSLQLYASAYVPANQLLELRLSIAFMSHGIAYELCSFLISSLISLENLENLLPKLRLDILQIRVSN